MPPLTMSNANSTTFAGLDPTIWGPHYWFFLHTIAMTYPIRPNDVTKKKYYELTILNIYHNLKLNTFLKFSIKIVFLFTFRRRGR